MVDSIGYPVKSEFMDDVPKNSLAGSRCKHGVLLAKRVRKGYKMYVFR
jgi:hypothetical protein